MAHHALPLPVGVNRRIMWKYAVPIVLFHLLSLLACVPWFFSWTGLILCLLGVHVYGKFVTLCYHRQLSHRSFKTPKWFERLSVLISLCSLQDTPARWVATHRLHHKEADKQPDPHSPLVNFLWSHIGWLMIDNSDLYRPAILQKYARDILDDPFYMRLEKNRIIAPLVFAVHGLLYFAVAVAIGWPVLGSWAAAIRLGLSCVVWGVVLRTVLVWHITWSVNSLTHLFGYRNYETGEGSRNNWVVAVITFGEGWHNNHHFDQAAASVQCRWWELDGNYYHIKVLEWLGLAYDVIPPKHQRKAVRGIRP